MSERPAMTALVVPVNWEPLPGWTTKERGVYLCTQCACIFADEDRLGICETCGEGICPNCECGCARDAVAARIAAMEGDDANPGT